MVAGSNVHSLLRECTGSVGGINMKNVKDKASITIGEVDENIDKNQSKTLKRVIAKIPREAENDPNVRSFAEGMRKIREGLLKPNSGTGTPIKDLYGGSKENVQLSNIGGGSKANGGGGMVHGRKIIAETAYNNGVVMERYGVKGGYAERNR